MDSMEEINHNSWSYKSTMICMFFMDMSYYYWVKKQGSIRNYFLYRLGLTLTMIQIECMYGRTAF